MKQIIGNISKIFLIAIFLLTIKSYAASLDNIDISLDKTNVKPGEEVKLSINFGESLGSYTFEIAYDNNVFEYVSADGGTANNTGDKVIVVFYDSTGGTAPRSNMSVTFKAKSNLTTSNPTNFAVTAEGLANPDGTETYEDISVPIVKNITVEPEYIDYSINLEATGDIIVDENKEMTLSFSSPLGKYYEHARLVASATTPEGGTVTLTGLDSSGLEHEIIQSGWGDASGFGIGGKDYSQVLSVKGMFSKVGDYVIILSLIDRDNSDSIITEKAFSFTVVEKNNEVENTETEENNTVTNENTIATEEDKDTNEIKNTVNTAKNTPSKLPKTGIDLFVPSVIILFSVIAIVVYYNKRK